MKGNETSAWQQEEPDGVGTGESSLPSLFSPTYCRRTTQQPRTPCEAATKDAFLVSTLPEPTSRRIKHQGSRDVRRRTGGRSGLYVFVARPSKVVRPHAKCTRRRGVGKDPRKSPWSPISSKRGPGVRHNQEVFFPPLRTDAYDWSANIRCCGLLRPPTFFRVRLGHGA